MNGTHAAWSRPVAAAIATTAVVTTLSYFAPPEHAASAVGVAFFLATYFLALRNDGSATERYGLSLGGLLDPEPLDLEKLLKSAAVELAWAIGICLVVFPPFWIGFELWWSPVRPFHPAPLGNVASDALGQFLVIALPEEAFYRGYLQTRLDEAWKPKVALLGARVGPALIVTSAIFAVGHLATELNPNRLAVFFPALLFGWLRNRRGGIGAAAALHALCNLFASYLAECYGIGAGPR
jgi:membrane protease YdiL (CAAX protease family)